MTTSDEIAETLGSSLYFGTQSAAIRAYAPEVVGDKGDFWLKRGSM